MVEYKKLIVETKELSKKEIFEKKLFNVFVFSLPRSGSSMMSSIVEALGVKMVYTSDDEEQLKKRNENERKRYGDKYQMNKNGFFEITKDVWKNYFEIMGTPNSGCKMIIPVARDRMGVVTFNPGARVVMMWRDPEEMRQSQQASYKGNAGVTQEEAETQRAMIRTKLVNQKLQLEKLKIDTLHIQYQDVLKDPKKEVTKVAKFIGADKNNIKKAVKCVKPKENRFKKEDLVENI